MNKKIASVAATLVAAITAHGQGTVVYDQQSSTESAVYEGNATIQVNQPFGQSFTPSLSAVGFVRLDLYTGMTAGGASVDILLHSGSITGPTIGISETVALPSNFSGFVNFIFDTPPSVTPGTQYYFQPVVQSGTDIVVANYSDVYNYGGGTAIFQGTAGVASDLWFREGVIVPEPSTWAVALLGAGLLIRVRRR